MSKPTTPLDSELAKIFGNNTRIFRAMRELFKQSGDLSPTAIEEALIAGGNAGAAANQALDTLERLTQAVELISLMSRDIDIKDDDLTPRQEIITQDSLADLSPRFEEDPTTLKEADIGDTVQAFSDALTSIAGLTTAANRMIFTTAADTYAVATLTAFARTLLDDANAAAARITLGLGTVAVQAGNQDLKTTDDVTFNKVTATVGIQLGGTGAANLQDDYEEGEFDITYTAGTGTVSVSGTRRLAYTKVGRLVYVQGDTDIASVVTPSGTLVMNGLPFAASSTLGVNAERVGFYIFTSNLNRAVNVLQGTIIEGGTTVALSEMTGTVNSTAVADIAIQFTIFRYGFSYITDL